MLLVQADRGLGSVLLLVEQTEELAVILPVPPGVAHLHKTFVLDLARDLAQRRECIGGRWILWPKLFFLRQPKRANARKNFKPRQKEPAHGGGQTKHPAAGYKKDRQE